MRNLILVTSCMKYLKTRIISVLCWLKLHQIHSLSSIRNKSVFLNRWSMNIKWTKCIRLCYIANIIEIKILKLLIEYFIWFIQLRLIFWLQKSVVQYFLLDCSYSCALRSIFDDEATSCRSIHLSCIRDIFLIISFEFIFLKCRWLP